MLNGYKRWKERKVLGNKDDKNTQKKIKQKLSPFSANTEQQQKIFAQQISAQNNQKDLAKHYSYAFVKYEAMQSNNARSWDDSMIFIKQLADKGHPLSCMLLAKDYYSRIGVEQMSKETRVDLLLHSADYFLKSVTETNMNGLYYLGEMLREFPQLAQQTTEKQIQEYFVYAAAYGNPLAYFNLAKIHERRGDMKLYIKYLKQAAQKGCLQAQHNLAQQYSKGLNIKKDHVKAFSWYVNAGAHGFVYSKNNAAIMLLNGSQCGRIKPNKKAALIYLQQIQRTGTLDVSQSIKYILQDAQIKRQQQLSQKQQSQSPQQQTKKQNKK